MSTKKSIELCPVTLIAGLLDGKAFVELLEVNPGNYPDGLSPEFSIVRSARISTRNPVSKGKQADDGLTRYLWRHKHTSPFEQVSFTFKVHLPIFIANHLIRHRTAKVNGESQRYADVISEFFNALLFEIRSNSVSNKQSSEVVPLTEEMNELLSKANTLVEEQYQIYLQLLKCGLAREIARSYLPLGTYTTLIYQIDLRNLLHFLTLRTGKDAQRECQVIANAMLQLIEPICPVTIDAWRKESQSLVLSPQELAYLVNKEPFENKTQEREFLEKKQEHPEFFERFN